MKDKKMMINAYLRWLASSNNYLWQVYKSYSVNKNEAMKDCVKVMEFYKGKDLKILFHNCDTFSVGFVNDELFFYITKDHTRVAPLNELEALIENY